MTSERLKYLQEMRNNLEIHWLNDLSGKTLQQIRDVEKLIEEEKQLIN